MKNAKEITYTVGVFMFLIQLRPLEPYMTAYLTGPNGNVSLSEVGFIVLTILNRRLFAAVYNNCNHENVQVFDFLIGWVAASLLKPFINTTLLTE